MKWGKTLVFLCLISCGGAVVQNQPGLKKAGAPTEKKQSYSNSPEQSQQSTQSYSTQQGSSQKELSNSIPEETCILEYDPITMTQVPVCNIEEGPQGPDTSQQASDVEFVATFSPAAESLAINKHCSTCHANYERLSVVKVQAGAMLNSILDKSMPKKQLDWEARFPEDYELIVEFLEQL